MILTETLLVVLIALVGWLLGPEERGDGGDGTRVAMAFPLGCGAVVVVQSVSLAVGLDAVTPRWSLALALALAVWIAVRRDARLVPSWGLAATYVVVAALMVTAANALHLTSFTFDSFQHVSLAELLRESRLEEARPHVVKKRTLALATLHGLASSGAAYLRALGPAVAASTVALLWFASRQELQRRTVAVGTAAVASLVAPAAVCVALVSNNRMAWLAVYLNGHALTAAWVLAVAVLVRRVVTGCPADTSVAVSFAIAAVTLARVEGAFVALLLVAPAVVERRVESNWRSWAVAAVGLSLVVFQGLTVGRMHLTTGTEIPRSAVALAALGLVLLHAAAQLDRLERFARNAQLEARELLWIAGLLLVVALMVATFLRPEITLVSIRETARNLFLTGSWGASLVVLGSAVLIVVVTIRIDRVETLLFPLAAFVPLALLLAHLRGGPYRAGIGDSLNRMFGHFVPLALLLLAVHAGGMVRDRRHRRFEQRPSFSG